MDKNIQKITYLYDLYSNLLTPIKQQYITLHFFHDMSLKEIAEQFKVSRAAVHSSILQGLEELQYYEKKLNFLKKQKIRLKLYNQIKDEQIKKKLFDVEFKER